MMSQSQYSLTWEAHVRNVCDGLSSLQQNGELVDMTLAADGHMVKVHQVVLALASPYFKELITSAQCPHPVIFLSKIKEATLSALLEYIYTGEVLVSLDHLNDLIDAAKELHIKGLKDMKVHSSLMDSSKQLATNPSEEIRDDQDLCVFQVSHVEEYEFNKEQKQNQDDGTADDDMMQFEDNNGEVDYTTSHDGQGDPHSGVTRDGEQTARQLQSKETQDGSEHQDIADKVQGAGNKQTVSTCPALQYTVSNQGSLQMILNRFVYYLKHTNRDKSRQWRCVDYLSTAKCPALVFTKDDMVIQRVSAHTHPFHDKKIFKKLRSGIVFSAFTEAEKEGNLKKNKSIDVNTESETTIIDSMN